MRKIRGNRISMIFQEPMTSLDPLFTIGDQIREAIQLHQRVSRKAAHEAAVSMLDKVGIPDAESRMKYYPFQLSGGMRQRVMIATALSCKPEILIADEPTTALDVTIQAQILDLLENLQRDIHMSMIMITHDLSLVKNITNRLMIMYAGKSRGRGPPPWSCSDSLSIPIPGACSAVSRGSEASAIFWRRFRGPSPIFAMRCRGCAFAPRCMSAMDVCSRENPSLLEVAPGHTVSCHLVK